MQQLWYPGAERRPLASLQGEPRIATPGSVPTVLTFHTMAGSLKGTESMFRENGFTGTESHFGVGGNWDKKLDGVVWQWQALDRQADAQNAGNSYSTSVETSDGGRTNIKWSPLQVDALIRLTIWWCRQTSNPARLVSHPTDRGIGYHAMFSSWAPDGRACPGSARIHQLTQVVIPAAAKALAALAPAPTFSKPDVAGSGVLSVNGYYNGATIFALQKALGTFQDGKITGQGLDLLAQSPGLFSRPECWIPERKAKPGGSPVIKAHQRILARAWGYADDIDGLVGPNYWKAAQRQLGTTADGRIDNPSEYVKELQRALNAGGSRLRA